MANLVLIARAKLESSYSVEHIRYLVRKGLVKGEKQGGTWLVDLDDLKRYEQAMEDLGPKKFVPSQADGES
jgi:hypothetical protein